MSKINVDDTNVDIFYDDDDGYDVDILMIEKYNDDDDDD